MRSTANTVLEHTLGQDVVCKRKKVVRKTKVVRREKVARTVAARRARATTTGRARFEFFWRFPAIRITSKDALELSADLASSRER